MFKNCFERTEIKYMLDDEQFAGFFSSLEGIAHIDQYGRSKIMNIYYDTPDFRMIRTSLEKPVYKEKLRLRTYGVPSSDSNAFVEIKKKYKGVVYKRRISMPYDRALGYLAGECRPDEETQISGEIDSLLAAWKNLAPAVVLSYDRIALAGDDDPDLRITFDDNICYRTSALDLTYGAGGSPIIKEGMHLMELKIAGAVPLNIARLLSEYRIYPMSFSKYGNAYTDLKSKENSVERTEKIILPVLNEKGVYKYA